MKKEFIFLLVLLASYSVKLCAQSDPFQLIIEPYSIAGLPGIQSYAFGQYDGNWLIVGGRLDGLHRRQPFASFDFAGNNKQLIVVNPQLNEVWMASLSLFSASIQEQLSSTNMQFYQEGNYLYLTGGYGYSATATDHITFPNLTAIDLPTIINAIKSGATVNAGIRQIVDTMFAVTGGRLEKIYDDYYLVGGQKFIGRYNPMGPTFGPGFYQAYTNAIRKFDMQDNGTTITVHHLSQAYDSINLHRRDYNVVPQIMPGGNEGLTAFSGVFQSTIDLPYLNCVNIDSSGYQVNNAFSQYYNHYHCAFVPIYSSTQNAMHTIFFGGIAQYFDSLGILVQNQNVPFVKTIARVTRSASGVMEEYKLPIEMPSYLGAGSEFIPIKSIPSYLNGVMKLDDILGDTTHIGYIFGGISSSDKNIFFINTGAQSTASHQLFKVKLIKNISTSLDEINFNSKGGFNFQCYPNPVKDEIQLQIYQSTQSPIVLRIFDMSGRKLNEQLLKNLPIGWSHFTLPFKGLEKGRTYLLVLESMAKKAIQKLTLAD